MKGLFSRLLGGSDDAAPAAAASPSQPAGPETGAATQQGRYDEVGMAFIRWLGGAVARQASPAAEALVLEQLARLAEAPAEAAALVPRVPEVIPQLLRSLRDENLGGAELARQVAQDVVLVAAVIREANSAYHRSATPVRSLENAIMMLGQNGLRMVIARVALRPIISMQSGRIGKLVAPRAWSQSEKCALAASLLAPGMQANQFEAYLAGLMQNVGLMAAIQLIDQTCPDEGMPRSDAFASALLASARALSARIAQHWELPAGVSAAIAAAGRDEADPLAQVLALGDMLAKLRVMVDAAAYAPDDPFVVQGLNAFQLRCFDKLQTEE